MRRMPAPTRSREYFFKMQVIGHQSQFVESARTRMPRRIDRRQDAATTPSNSRSIILPPPIIDLRATDDEREAYALANGVTGDADFLLE